MRCIFVLYSYKNNFIAYRLEHQLPFKKIGYVKKPKHFSQSQHLWNTTTGIFHTHIINSNKQPKIY